MVKAEFVVGQTYKRSEIHNKYGGQRQGGISTPSKYPMILIFTGGNGELYGYKDSWDRNVFYYTGEGQKGDMEFVAGNKAIRDSEANDEEIHLFKNVKKSYVEYIGQMEYLGYEKKPGYDVNRQSRQLIIFKLKLV